MTRFLSDPMSSITPQPVDRYLSRRMLDAFEREFWAGHHDRTRLMSAPLRVLAEALDPGCRALLERLLHELCGGATDRL
jgi:hypothetical protein